MRLAVLYMSFWFNLCPCWCTLEVDNGACHPQMHNLNAVIWQIIQLIVQLIADYLALHLASKMLMLAHQSSDQWLFMVVMAFFYIQSLGITWNRRKKLRSVANSLTKSSPFSSIYVHAQGYVNAVCPSVSFFAFDRPFIWLSTIHSSIHSKVIQN